MLSHPGPKTSRRTPSPGRPPAYNSGMATSEFAFDADRAVARLMRFLEVEGVTGQEEAIGREVVKALVETGVPRKAVRFDQANEQIPLPTQTGNLIVTLPGTRPGPRRLFMTHLDTVPLCAGAVPVRKGDRIVPKAATALGGDNRTGVACLVTLAATLLERNLPHPPLTFLFTVREESGLWGARFVRKEDLGDPDEGYNVDGSSASNVTVGATGAERWEVEIRGRASHAGVYPEYGVSATLVAALALGEVYRGGWFGKVVRDGQEGTSNVGSFGGKDGTASAGEATNVVTDYVLIRGESRSHDSGLVREITAAYRDAFHHAASQVRNANGRTAKVRFQTRRDYYPFRLRETAPVVRHAVAAAERAGLTPVLRVTNGGLDANWLVRHGVPTVTFGAGQNNVHTTEEFVDVKEFLNGCRLALALATT
jgi:tripeptide aminopeptidase